MCGIFAWAGKNPKTFNRDKYDILGIYNIERGRDSCGVSYDGDIYPGVDGLKLYSQFLVANKVNPKKIPVVIGHTRQASAGNIVNAENAHPFGFGSTEDNNFEFIGCHNGTLYNKTELAELYDITTTVTEEHHSAHAITTKTRSKIDSEILLECLYKSKDYSVLSKYNGAAALVFTNTNEKNVISVWKGASKFYDYASNQVQEERPLFYYKQSKNSLYISSIEHSLVAIGGVVGKTVFSFDENTIYRITDGDIDNAEKIAVSREGATQKESYTTKRNYGGSNTYHNGAFNFNDDAYFEDEHYKKPGYNNVLALAYKNKNTNITTPSNQSSKLKSEFNIYNESTPVNINLYGNKIYYNKFRYWRTGHVITGIYTWIPFYGFYWVGETSIETAQKELERIKGKIFIDGEFINDSEGIDLSNPEVQSLIPFKEDRDNSKSLHYFIQGVKLIDPLDYKMTYLNYYDDYIKKGKYIDYKTMSHMSNSPIMDMGFTYRMEDGQQIYMGGNLVKEEKLCPLLSERIYTIENGNVTHHKDLNLTVGVAKNKLYNSIKTKEGLISYLNKDKGSVETEVEDIIDITNTDETAIMNQLIDESLTEMSVELDEIIKLIKSNTSISEDLKSEKIKGLHTLQDYMEVVNN